MSDWWEESLPAIPPGGKEYRLPRFNLVVGIVGIAFTLFLGVGGTWTELANDDGSLARPVLFAVCYGVLCGGMLLVCVYATWSAYHERLLIDERRVHFVGSFRTQTIQLTEVSRAVWGSIFGGEYVTLHSPAGKVTIHFNRYVSPGSRELVSYFRQAVPLPLQERWDAFLERCYPTRFQSWVRERKQNRRLIGGTCVVLGMLGVGFSLGDFGLWPDEKRWVVGIVHAGVLVLGVRVWRSARSIGTAEDKG